MAFGAVRSGTLTGTNLSIPNPMDATGSISGVSVGDLVFCLINQETNLTVTAATDNLGNTYVATNAGSDAGTVTCRAFYSRVTVAGTLTVIHFATTSSTNNVVCGGVVFEGPFAAPPIDANPANVVSDPASPYLSNATGTLAQADELVVSWNAVGTAGTDLVATSPNIAAFVANVANAGYIRIGSQVVSATTSITPAWTGTNTTQNVLGVTSFMKEAAAADTIQAQAVM